MTTRESIREKKGDALSLFCNLLLFLLARLCRGRNARIRLHLLLLFGAPLWFRWLVPLLLLMLSLFVGWLFRVWLLLSCVVVRLQGRNLLLQFHAGPLDLVVLTHETDPVDFQVLELFSCLGLRGLPLPVHLLNLFPEVLQLLLQLVQHAHQRGIVGLPGLAAVARHELQVSDAGGLVLQLGPRVIHALAPRSHVSRLACRRLGQLVPFHAHHLHG
uniref:Uncharacterized protein n=1 Tax=Ixodes ricinus TaxID=34613 RepID=A0A6B0V3K1_IXORI